MDRIALQGSFEGPFGPLKVQEVKECPKSIKKCLGLENVFPEERIMRYPNRTFYGQLAEG